MNAFTYTDLFYTDHRRPVTVRAVVSMLSPEKGGHRITSQHSWRPNHNFGAPDGRSFYIGQVDIDGSDINAGDTREVLVQFLDGPGLRELLYPGRDWRIQEGPRLIALAKVIELVGET